jgi:hypothetical protein
VRISPSGEILGTIELQAPVAGLVFRAGRVYAAAGVVLYQIDPDAGWQITHRIQVPDIEEVHTLDVDHKGKRAVVVQNPDRGRIVEIATGECSSFALTKYLEKSVNELDVRFSSQSDHMFAALSRSHQIRKLSPRGHKTGELPLHSTWCTPLASSPEGRWLAARQSGVGIIVWDLADERQLLFAELDDSSGEEKYQRSARVMVAAVKVRPSGSLKVTRWRPAPEFEGQATAIGVAPGCAYVATGDRDGWVTLVDAATRRIERSDGQVRQEACLSATVQVPERAMKRRVGDELFFLTLEGSLSKVHLATGEQTALANLGLTAPYYLPFYIQGEELIVIAQRRVCGFDLRTFEMRWSFDDPLPMCKRVSFDGLALMGIEDLGGDARALRRFNPRTGELATPVPVSVKGTRIRAGYEMQIHGRNGRYYLDGTCDPSGETRYFPITADGVVGPAVPERGQILEDLEHVFVADRSSWWLAHVGNPWTPLLKADIKNGQVGFTEVDLRNRRVAARDPSTWRMHVWTLEGEPVVTLDALGYHGEGSYFGPGASSLWTLENGGALRRYELPSASR